MNNVSFEVRDLCFLKDDFFIDIEDEGKIYVTDLRPNSLRIPIKFVFEEYDFMAMETIDES